MPGVAKSRSEPDAPCDGVHKHVYSGKVADQYWPYIRPQENENKTDVRWVTITNSAGQGLLFKGRQLLEVSAHHQIMEDFGQMGVGGDNSWGAWTHEKYRLTQKKYSYGFWIKPVKAE